MGRNRSKNKVYHSQLNHITLQQLGYWRKRGVMVDLPCNFYIYPSHPKLGRTKIHGVDSSSLVTKPPNQTSFPLRNGVRSASAQQPRAGWKSQSSERQPGLSTLKPMNASCFALSSDKKIREPKQGRMKRSRNVECTAQVFSRYVRKTEKVPFLVWLVRRLLTKIDCQETHQEIYAKISPLPLSFRTGI